MSTNTPKASNLYRVVWRWHFYAGILVAPFIIFLAITGAIYLFNDEINDALYTTQRFVPIHEKSLPPGDLVDVALSNYPGTTASRIDLTGDPRRSAQVFLTPQTGEPFRVYVDPGTGRILGDYIYTHTLVGFADVAHGSLMLGKFGDGIVELAACWAIILIVTGTYLWWPRGRKVANGVILPRLSSTGRTFWRDIHATTGFWTGALILFLLLTGLPWANIWGEALKMGFNVVGIGYPIGHRQHDAPLSRTLKEAFGNAPWTLESTSLPLSAHHAEHGTASSVPQEPVSGSLDANQAAVILAQYGMIGTYRLFLPQGPRGVFTGYTYPDQPQGQRTIHVDRYSGEVLGDIKFSDYGWGAKAVELGVQLHMGNYFGPLNQAVMLIACLGAIAMAITGPVMWLRRKPKGTFGAPPMPSLVRLRGMVIVIFGFAILFPLVGLSLILVLGGDYLVSAVIQRSHSK